MDECVQKSESMQCADIVSQVFILLQDLLASSCRWILVAEAGTSTRVYRFDWDCWHCGSDDPRFLADWVRPLQLQRFLLPSARYVSNYRNIIMLAPSGLTFSMQMVCKNGMIDLVKRLTCVGIACSFSGISRQTYPVGQSMVMASMRRSIT